MQGDKGSLWVVVSEVAIRLSGTTGVDLAEDELLEFVVHGQDTGTGNTSEDVGTSSLEQGLDSLLGDDLGTSVEHALVVGTGTSRGHHHSSPDGVQGVRSETGTGGNSPTEQERGQEGSLQRSLEDGGLQRVVKTEVQSTVDNDTNDGRNESTVETGDTVGSESLLVNRDETVELPGTTLLGRLVVVGETGSGVVERVDEEKGRGTGSSTGSDVTGEPLGVRLRLLEVEHGLEVVLEGKVQRLGREVPDDVGGVSSPERDETLIGVGPGETVRDTLVRGSETTLLDHLVLVLDQELDSLNRGGSGLGDSGGDTSHHEVDGEGLGILRLLNEVLGLGNGGHFGTSFFQLRTGKGL